MTAPSHASHRVLVPILGDDITDAALAAARTLLAGEGSELVLLHLPGAPVVADRVAPVERPGEPAAWHPVPRWRRLAAAVPSGRVFVDAALGEPARVIVAQAERFGSDVVVLGQPACHAPHEPRIDRIIAHVLGAVPGRVLIATDADARTAEPPPAAVAPPPQPRRDHARRPHARTRTVWRAPVAAAAG